MKSFRIYRCHPVQLKPKKAKNGEQPQTGRGHEVRGLKLTQNASQVIFCTISALLRPADVNSTNSEAMQSCVHCRDCYRDDDSNKKIMRSFKSQKITKFCPSLVFLLMQTLSSGKLYSLKVSPVGIFRSTCALSWQLKELKQKPH